MANDSLIETALSRGYSLDEIADTLATKSGFDPADIRERGYSSAEILGKLGYDYQEKASSSDKYLEKYENKPGFFDTLRDKVGLKDPKDIKRPENVTDNSFTEGAPEEVEPAKKVSPGMRDSVMKDYESELRDTSSRAPLTSKARRTIENQYDAGNRAKLVARDDVIGQVARDREALYKSQTNAPVAQKFDERVEARQRRLVADGEDPRFAEVAAQEAAKAGVAPGKEVQFLQDAYGTIGEDPSPIGRMISEYESAPTGKKPDDTIEVIGNALMRGEKQTAAIGAGLLAAGAKSIGADDTALGLLKEYFRLSADAKKYPGQIEDFTHIKSFGDVPTYVLEAVLENSPQLIGTVGSGVLGAALVKRFGARTLADGLVSVTAKELARRQAIGAAAGAGATAIGMEVGSIYGDVAKDTGQEKPGVAFAFGTAAGMLDAIPAMRAATKILGEEAVSWAAKEIAKRYGKEAAVQLGTEGGTEFLQTWIEKAATTYVDGRPLLTKENLIGAVDAFLKGGSAGVATGVGSQAIHDVRNLDAIAADRQAEAAKARALGVWNNGLLGTGVSRSGSTPEQAASTITAQPSVDQAIAATNAVVSAPIASDAGLDQMIAEGQAAAAAPAPAITEDAAALDQNILEMERQNQFTEHRPQTLQGAPVDSYSDEQLQAIAEDTLVPMTTRRNAQVELAARLTTPAQPTTMAAPNAKAPYGQQTVTTDRGQPDTDVGVSEGLPVLPDSGHLGLLSRATKGAQFTEHASDAIPARPGESEQVVATRRAEAEAVEEILGQAGITAHFVSSNDGVSKFGGLYVKGLKGHVFIDVTSNGKIKHALRVVAAHEALHAMREIDPEFYNTVVKELEAVGVKLLSQEEFAKMYSGELRDEDHTSEEQVANIYGNVFYEPKNMAVLYDRITGNVENSQAAVTKVAKLVAHLRRAFAQLRKLFQEKLAAISGAGNKLGGRFVIDSYVNDLDAAEKVVLKAFYEFAAKHGQAKAYAERSLIEAGKVNLSPVDQKVDNLQGREDRALSVVSANPGAGRYVKGEFTYKGATLGGLDSDIAGMASSVITREARSKTSESNTGKWERLSKEAARTKVEANPLGALRDYYLQQGVNEHDIAERLDGVTPEQVLAGFDKTVGDINAGYGPAQRPPMLQERAAQAKGAPLNEIHEGATAILRSNKKWLEGVFGISNLKFNTVSGSFMGNPELSFAITADGMTPQIASDLASLLGVGMVQDQVVHRVPVNPADPEQFIIPSLVVGNAKMSKITPAEREAFKNEAAAAGLDYTETTGNDGFLFHHFGPESEYQSWFASVSAVANNSGLGSIVPLNLSSDIYDANIPQGRESWRLGSLLQESGPGDAGRKQRAGQKTGWQLLVDRILAPYIKLISGHGYRVSPDRFALRYGLSTEETEYLRKALYPKGAEGSVAPILYDGETLRIIPSGDKENKPTNQDVGNAVSNRSARHGVIEPGDYSDQAANAIARVFADEIARRVEQESINPELKKAKGWYEKTLREALRIMSEHFPELHTDNHNVSTNPHARFIFNGILALTSQGMDVKSNFKAAAVYYNSIRQEAADGAITFGRLDPALAPNLLGDKTAAIQKNLAKFQQIVDILGWQEAEKLMMTKGKVKDINKKIKTELPNLTMEYEETQEDGTVETVVKPIQVAGAADRISRGWMVFGPKIGSFANNLYGDFSTLTADLWFTRTYNRVLGYMFARDPALETKQVMMMRDAILNEFEEKWRQTGAGEWKLTQDAAAEIRRYDAKNDAVKVQEEKIAAVYAEIEGELNATKAAIAGLEQAWRDQGFKTNAAKFRADPAAKDQLEALKSRKADLSAKVQDEKKARKKELDALKKEKKQLVNAREKEYSHIAHMDPAEVERAANADPDRLFDLAYLLYRDYANYGFKRRTPLNRAAKNFFEGSSKLIAAPRNSSEGLFQQEVAERAQSFLRKKHGEDINIADIQALLWFEEKDLFRSFGAGTNKADSADYADAARETINLIKQGLLDEHSTTQEEADDETEANESPIDQPVSSGQGDVQQRGEGAAGAVRVPAPRYGNARTSAVTVRGVHYSGQERATLDSNYFGTGLKGEERARLAAKQNVDIRARTYFYVDEGQGLLPEQGVGDHAHDADLQNLYDLKADPIGYRKLAGDDASKLERLVMRGGFDGYYAPGLFGRQGVAVLIGKHAFQPRYLGTGYRGGEVKGSVSNATPGETEAQRLKKSKLPGGMMKGREWQQAIKGTEFDNERRQANLEAAADKDIYRDDLVRYSPVSQPAFFSQLERAVEGAPDKVFGPAKQVALWLQSNKAKLGIKDDELQWTGVLDWLGAQQGKVTKADVLGYLGNNQIQVKDVEKSTEDIIGYAVIRQMDGRLLKRFDKEVDAEDYAQERYDEFGERLSVEPDYGDNTNHSDLVLPGGDNYKELLLTLPGEHKYQPPRAHWSESNVLAHIRINDRTDADGNKVLFVEEVQSDWGQEGKKNGFQVYGEASPSTKVDGTWMIKWSDGTIDDMLTENVARIVAKEGKRDSTAVMQAPFVAKTEGWVDLALKRITMYAVQHGYDKVAFVNGEQSAERYDLAKKISTISYNKLNDGEYAITAVDTSNNRVLDKDIAEADLEDVVGKEIAQKIIADPKGRGTLRGLDLKVGGEGMNTFYDRIVPQRLSKLLPKLGGGKTDTVLVKTPYKNDGQRNERVNLFREKMYAKYGNGIMLKMTPEEMAHLKALEDGGVILKQTGFTITPQMKATVGEGVPLFSPAGQAWAAPELKKLDNFIYEAQDKLIDLKRVRDAIRESGITIREQYDAYMTEELYHGRAAYRVQLGIESEFMPLLEEMRMRGITVEAFDKYLHARHAAERNRAMAKANPNQAELDQLITDAEDDVMQAELDLQMAQSSGKDVQKAMFALQRATAKLNHLNATQPYSGTEDERQMLSGMSNRDASDYLNSLGNKRAAFDALGAKVDDIVEENRRLLEGYGLETADTVDALRQAYSHYVPLQREMDDSDLLGTGGGLGTGAGYGVRGSTLKRATGSLRKVESILAHLMAQREQIVVRGEKALVGKSIYAMALSAPNPDFWTVIRPDMSAKELKREMQRAGLDPTLVKAMEDAPMEAYIDEKTGVVRWRINPLIAREETAFVVRIAGQDRVVLFNKNNDRAVRLAQSLKNLDTDHSKGWWSGIENGVGFTTRWISSVNTQYNPVFGLKNFIRDYQEAGLNLSTTEISDKKWEVLNPSHIASALRAIYRQERGKSATNAEWDRAWTEFRASGAETGYKDMFNGIEDRVKHLERLIKPGKGALVWKYSGLKYLAEWLSDYNTAIENGVRLSAFKAARDAGLSPQKAASIAKNLTVNFNRKGRSARKASAYYAFFNAAVQGNARALETLQGGHKGKAAAIYAMKFINAGIGLGAMLTLLGLAMMGDDWDDIPDFIRERDIIIPLGKSDVTGERVGQTKGGYKYLHIPMALGFHMWPNLGRNMVEMAYFRDKFGKRITDTLVQTVQAFNPMGGGSDPFEVLLPTLIKPGYELAKNQNVFGRPIAKQNYSDKDPTPAPDRFFRSASSVGKGISWVLDRASGGDGIDPGLVQVTPDQIDYVFGTITGGLGREGLKLYQYVESKATGDKIPESRVPIKGMFYGETRSEQNIIGKFSEMEREINIAKKELKSRNSEGAKATYLENNPEARLIPQMEASVRQINKLSKLRKAADGRGDKEEVKRLDNMATEIRSTFLDAFEAERKRKLDKAA